MSQPFPRPAAYAARLALVFALALALPAGAASRGDAGALAAAGVVPLATRGPLAPAPDDLGILQLRRQDEAFAATIDAAFGRVLGSPAGAPPLTSPGSAWTRVTQVFNVAAAGTYRLAFAGTGVTDRVVDGVSIAPRAGGTVLSVPLPGGLVLAASAIGVLMTTRRRRRR